jgi:hypothetical protein
VSALPAPVYTDDGLVAYASETSAKLRADFPWMPAIIWTSRPADGASLHSSGDTADEALANWRARHGEPARFIERLAA